MWCTQRDLDVDKNKYLYILQQVHRDILLRLCIKLLFYRLEIPDNHIMASLSVGRPGRSVGIL